MHDEHKPKHPHKPCDEPKGDPSIPVTNADEPPDDDGSTPKGNGGHGG